MTWSKFTKMYAVMATLAMQSAMSSAVGQLVESEEDSGSSSYEIPLCP